MRKSLLQEDECAPDAREHFAKQMKQLTGFTFKDFTDHGKIVTPDEMTGEIHYEGYILSFCAENPFYKLEQS